MGRVKTLVLGLGNPILTDDGVGVYVARAVADQLSRADLTVAEASVGGLRLLDRIAGYDRVILVDAVQTPHGTPGEVYRLRPGDLPTLHSGSSHDLSLTGALALGRRLGFPIPDDQKVVIVAIEVEDVLTFGEQCTPAVAAAIPKAVQMVMDEIGQGSGDDDGR